MKITLFLNDRLINFELPQEISGNYTFDENPNEESKLINIEARDNKWYIYSTEDTKIVYNNIEKKEKEISDNMYINLKRFDKVYLIYLNITKNDKMMTYKFSQELNMLIGNDSSCNIIYNNQFINSLVAKVSYKENKLVLEASTNTLIYINNKRLENQEYNINVGDKLSIFNLNITFLNGLLLINNPNKRVKINDKIAHIELFKYIQQRIRPTEEIKDKDLYTEDMYFSKAPILRRFIEEKEIKIDAPPQNNDNDEMPLIMTIAPMLTMGITSLTTLLNTILKLNSGQTDIESSWPQLVSGVAMLLSSMLWPVITNIYNKHRKKVKEKETKEKYHQFLQEKELEFANEKKLQHDILVENLIPLKDCLEQIKTRGMLFWNRRSDQSDFLTVRLGIGNEKLKVEVDYQEEGFTVEVNELRKDAEALVKKYEYIPNVPIGYSLYEDNIVAIMGERAKTVAFTNNLLLQLLTFYSYEDIKIVFFTMKEYENDWEYIKYLNHTFSNNKQIRFFAVEDQSKKNLAEYLNIEVMNRQNSKSEDVPKPYYIIITDDYNSIKRYDFIKTISESEDNLGFSLVMIENKLSRLPSKCSNFISLSGSQFVVLKNKTDKQEQYTFTNEIDYNINMMNIAKILANIPIEFEEGVSQLPESVSFMEMEQVGKVSQLNILNRWNTNDPISSLKAEVGVDNNNNLMYLDLHEKYHGPHGLIAGTTGSGKSEFIITYILSMAMNYSPEYVSFILIDYKGGGLAGAFENKMTGVYLPHLAGTITNLDKAEMDRTLVSIDSEVKRRQAKFNEARDKLGESTIDIYKYENFYREGKLTEPIPHLFIICDEFAELKAQQPEFMDNLISVARIGRSLGVHLILATQKPSGVVNDQIWSNTKFRVCLKVASEADSKEMLKRPEAAHIKQAGRFYLQVGMDEIFELGQSGYCGAKYFPSDKVIKTVDKSVNFINDCGQILKSVKPSSGNSKQAQGEQIAAIMKEIIAISKQTNKKADRLWLENIPPVILIDEIIKKYNIKRKENSLDVEAIIGEYDIPENQEQGLLKYNYLADGNAIIYGLDSTEKELLLKSIIYSTTLYYKPEEINHYIIDYGSESLKIFEGIPHVGGVVLSADEEKFNNLIKLIKEEINSRKKILSNYGGEFENYQKSTNNKLPIISIIINNYPGIIEAHDSFNYDEFPALTRDSERYGIVFIVTTTGSSSISQKIVQNFKKMFAFKLKDIYEYLSIFNTKKKLTPRDNEGRGIFKSDNTHEFQTAYIINPDENLNDYLLKYRDSLKEKYKETAKRIPELPLIVRFENIKNEISTIEDIPIGISKNDMEVVKYNFKEYNGTLISAYKLGNTDKFIISLIQTLSCIKNNVVLTIDGTKKFELLHNYVKNLYNDKLKESFEAIDKYFDKVLENNNQSLNYIIVIYGFGKFLNEVETKKFDDFFKKVKNAENIRFIVVETPDKIKEFIYEQWFKSLFNLQYGIYVGKGIADQNVLKINSISKEFKLPLNNNMGYKLEGGENTCIKLIDYVTKDGEEDE